MSVFSHTRFDRIRKKSRSPHPGDSEPKRRSLLLAAGLLACVVAEAGAAGGADTSASPGSPASMASKVRISGYGYMMFGELVRGEAGNSYVDSLSHYWMNFATVHLNIASDVRQYFTTRFSIEMQMQTPFKGATSMAKGSYYMQYQVYIPAAEGIFHWTYKRNTISSFKLESGLFPYTFNPAVTNLGNYLYRGTAKPLFVGTRVDYPWADLMGFRAEFGMFRDRLTVEALLNSEIQYVPWFDWCPGVTVAYRPGRMLDIGAGINFPHMMESFRGWEPGVPDSVADRWKATRLDARAIIDLKPLLGRRLAPFMGPEGAKLYVEAALLGLKDSMEHRYPKDSVPLPANSLKHRMPLLMGVDLPTGTILDLLSVEFEYFGSPYPDDWFGSFNTKQAISTPVSGIDARRNYIACDNWKWSVFVRKAFDNFEIRCLVANDHTIYKPYLTDQLASQQTMKKPGDWQWMLEFRYNL